MTSDMFWDEEAELYSSLLPDAPHLTFSQIIQSCCNSRRHSALEMGDFTAAVFAHTHVCRCTQIHPSVWNTDTQVHKGIAVGYTCTAFKCVNVLLEPSLSRWNPALTRAGSCPCLFLRPESLASPSVFLCVRDLHANDQALSTGEPEEEQSRLCCVGTTHCIWLLFYSSPPGSGSCPSIRPRWKGGDKCPVWPCVWFKGRLFTRLTRRPAPTVCVCVCLLASLDASFPASFCASASLPTASRDRNMM